MMDKPQIPKEGSPHQFPDIDKRLTCPKCGAKHHVLDYKLEEVVPRNAIFKCRSCGREFRIWEEIKCVS